MPLAIDPCNSITCKYSSYDKVENIKVCMEIEAKKFILKCVVPENIHTLTTEGIGNLKVVVFKSPGNSRGVGGGGGWEG